MDKMREIASIHKFSIIYFMIWSGFYGFNPFHIGISGRILRNHPTFGLISSLNLGSKRWKDNNVHEV